MGIMYGLVGGIYMKAVYVIHFAKKAGSSIFWSTCVQNTRLDVFHFIQLNVLSFTGCRFEPLSLITQEGPLHLLKIYHLKDLQTYSFVRKMLKLSLFIPM